MGHECVLDGCIRSSAEFRRIKNAKITAKRHRKWQEVRLQREQEEKKAAEEFLKWRRRERARLATYIYASAQNVDKESSRISQEYMNKNIKTWERKRDDYVCNTQTNQKKGTEKDIVLDVCSLPTILIKEEPCQKALQEHHVGDGQKKSEDPTDFLQDALQERLQNEAATSCLIAEITDMKSRLDDILARPSKGYLEGCEKDGFECEKIKLPCESSEKEHDRSNDIQLRERTVAEDFTKASQVANKPKCCMYLDHEGFAHENQVANRMKCCVHRVHALDNLKTNKIKFHPPSKASAALFACEQLKPESERSLLQQKRNGEQARSGKSSMTVTGVAQENDCNHISLSCHNKECSILQRVSQGLGELEAEGNILVPIEEDMHERTTIGQANAGYRFMKEHPVGIMKVSSRPKCPLRASNLSPTHKGSLVKPLFGSKESKENASLCLKSRKESSKLLEFLDAENSLLASLERLDVKLAMASANISNSSRTSLVSAGHQSTKSAPCMARGKSGSDAYSINSTMFFSRPTVRTSCQFTSFSVHHI